MTIQNRQQSEQKSESQRGCLPVLVRLAWIFGGILLVFCAVFIAQGKAPVLADLVLLVFTFVLILIRFVDIKFLHGETMDNKPATLKHWRRFSITVLIAAGLLYSLAKIIAHYKLM